MLACFGRFQSLIIIDQICGPCFILCVQLSGLQCNVSACMLRLMDYWTVPKLSKVLAKLLTCMRRVPSAKRITYITVLLVQYYNWLRFSNRSGSGSKMDSDFQEILGPVLSDFFSQIQLLVLVLVQYPGEFF